MSKAEELLNDLTTGETDSYVTELTEEPHIVIGPDRYIIVPDQLKRIAVQFDHDIETVTFDCPRYWDEHDMSKMKIYINYMRSDNAMGSYIAKNIAIDETDDKIMHFTWTISKEVTLIHGNLSFLVCINTVDSDGNETNHWNSELNTDMFVSKGLEVKEFVLSKYPDIITQLLIRMDEVEYKTTQKALLDLLNEYLENDPEMQTVLKDYIIDFMKEDPDAEETIYRCVSEYIETHLKLTDETLSIKGTPADAAAVGAALTEIKEIIQTKEGNILVYPNTAESGFHGLRLYGRSEQFTTSGAQLLNVNKFDDGSDVGITWLFQDGYVKVSGVATSNSMRAIDINLEPGMYALNGLNEGDLLYRAIITTADGVGKYYYDTFVITGSELSVRIQFQVNMYSNINEFIFYPMLNKGSEVLPWEPYTGGIVSPNPAYPQEIVSVGKDGNVEVSVYGNQIANLPDTEEFTNPNDGITWSCKNGAISAKGTALVQSSSSWGGIRYELPIVAGSYYVSGGSNIRVQCLVTKSDDTVAYYAKQTFTLDGTEKKCVLYAVVYPNVTVNETVYPMLNIGTEPLPFEPYKGKTLTALTPNGLPGIKVTDPALATYTDEDGQMWVADEVDFERGVYIQRVLCETVKMKLSHTKTNTRVYNGTMSKLMKGGGGANVALCSHSNNYEFNDNDRKHFYIAKNNYNVNVYVGLDEELTYVTVLGILATPIETTLSIDEITAYKALMSNSTSTTIMNSENLHMRSSVVTGVVGDDVLDLIEKGISKVRDEFIPNNDVIIKSNTQNGFKGKGWYRIAKFVGDNVATARGALCNSAEIIIKRGYGADTSEYHHILLASRYFNSLMYPFLSYCDGYNDHLFTKIRQVVDADKAISYLELYYDSDERNHAVVQLLNTSTIEGYHWEKADIELAQAQEDLGSLELFAQMDIPLNCHPTTDLDLDVIKRQLNGENLGSGDANECTTSTKITVGTPSNWSNLPTNLHGVLEVKDAGYYILQQYTTGSKDRRVYYRFFAGSTWSDWDEFSRAKDLAVLDTQLGSICYKEIYDPNGGSHIDVIKSNWNSLPAGILLVKVISGTTQVAWVYKHDNNYGSVRFTGYFVDQEYFYNLQNGTWTSKMANARLIDLDNYIPLTDNNALLKKGGMIAPNGDMYFKGYEKWFSTWVNEKLDKAGGTLTGHLYTRDIYPDSKNARYCGLTTAPWLLTYANQYRLYKNDASYASLEIVREGTTSEEGLGVLNLGNSTQPGTAGNAKGQIRLYNSKSGFTSITPTATASVELTLPTKSGKLLSSADFTVSGDDLILEWL